MGEPTDPLTISRAEMDAEHRAMGECKLCGAVRDAFATLQVLADLAGWSNDAWFEAQRPFSNFEREHRDAEHPRYAAEVNALAARIKAEREAAGV